VADGYVAQALPYFQAYSRDALTALDVRAGMRVLDVAAGPGTLTLLAAERGARVQALDFSEAMTLHLRRRAEEAGLAHLIDATEGDGQKLPFSPRSFDVGFSLFGLMFFPDRVAGLRELVRVLRPGGEALVSSWVPFAGPFAAVMESVRELLPGLPVGGGAPVWGKPEDIVSEMTTAGFLDVTVETVVHELVAGSFAEFWGLLLRTNAPIVLLRHRLGEAQWAEVAPKIEARVAKTLGDGRIVVGRGAFFGRGRTPR
jgi:SAM-dependent methyltransferase